MGSTSWVHKLFHPKRVGAGDYRFCKHADCWPTVESQPAVEDLRRLSDAGWRASGVYACCCLNKAGSTSSMVNHTRGIHSERLPEGIQKERQGEDGDPARDKVDPALMREWSTQLVLKCLHPVSLVEDVKAVPHIKNLGGSSMLQGVVNEQINEIEK